MYELFDPSPIEAYLRQNTALHLYEIGDLDPFFWPRTRWFALPRASNATSNTTSESDATPDALCLLYEHPTLATLIVMCEPEQHVRINELCAAVAPVLPDNVHLHRSASLTDTLLPSFELTPRGEHIRMMLTAPALDDVPTRDVIALDVADTPRLEAFYRDCYPDNWFDRRMLETGCYFAIEIDNKIASVAGVHVMSRQHRVAALGNIATAPAHRGRGLARRVSAACCRHLVALVDDIGLNVHVSNTAAIACYRRLGFTAAAHFHEATATRIG